MDEIIEALNGSYTGSGHRVTAEYENELSDNLWLWHYAPEQSSGRDDPPKIGIARLRDNEGECVVELLQGSDPRPYDFLTIDCWDDVVDFLRDEIARR